MTDLLKYKGYPIVKSGNKIYYGEDIKLWQISTDTAEHNPCFDITLVSSDRIQRFNVGNGEDAEVEIK